MINLHTARDGSLLDTALTEAAQLKEAIKQSKKDFHISHATSSGDGTDFESMVPNEKISGTDEGAGTKPGLKEAIKQSKKDFHISHATGSGDGTDFESGVPNEKISGTDEGASTKPGSNEEYEEEKEEYVDERVHTPQNYELTHEEDNTNNTKEEYKDEEDDAGELYRDINVNLRK
nr:hypothetical protein [Tanacetum cinerariifolium]